MLLALLGLGHGLAWHLHVHGGLDPRNPAAGAASSVRG